MSGLKKSAGRTAFRYKAGNQTGGMNMEAASPDQAAAYKTVLAQMQNSEKVDEALESGTVPQNLDKGKTLGTDWLLTGALEGLKSSKKYEGQKRSHFVFDSSEYKKVKNMLSQILESMNRGFSEYGPANREILRDVVIKYQKLDDACNVYLKKKGGTSATGKSRKEQVAMIKNLIEADRVHLQYLAFDAGEEELSALSGQTWGQVLDYARAGVVEEENFYAAEKFGQGVKTGDNAGRILKSGMFTKEDILKNSKSMSAFGLNSFSSINTNEEGMQVYGTENDEKINMSNRNVAMSRIANLLGIGDVIEQSKTVRVKDKTSGETIRGNLMTKAKGIKAGQVINQLRPQIKAERDVNKKEDDVFEKFSPTLQKELSSIQVLDYLCGQGDRHAGNFFLETNENEQYAHVHGIDNDNAFSTGVDLEAEIKKRKNYVNYQKMVVDSKDNLVIAHMDAKLAQNILRITDDEIEYAIKDLIEPKYIEYTKQRFKKMRAAIKKEKEGSKKFLNDGEWNRDTHDDFMAQTSFFKQIILPNRNAGIQGDDEKYYEAMKGVDKSQRDLVYERIKGSSYYSELIYNIFNLGGNEMMHMNFSK